MYPNTRMWPTVEHSISVIAIVVLLAVAVPALAGDSDQKAVGTPTLEARLAAHIAAGDLQYRDPATNEVVVVFPWVPATATVALSRISSASISARRTTGTRLSSAASTSGLPR